MNITEFKKQVKGISTGKKKQKAVQHQEYILSGTTDGTMYNSVIVVVPSHVKTFEIVTHRNKPFCYIVNSLEQLKDQDILKEVTQVYGLNYLLTLDKKQIATFNRRKEKIVPGVEYQYFVEVTGELGNYETLKKHYTSILVSEYGEITKENQKQLQQIAREKGYLQEINNAYSRYRQKFEIFNNTYGYNPFNYNLKIK